MRSARLLGAVLLALPLVAQDAPRVTTLQLPKGTACTGQLHTDVDGDGRKDLVLAVRQSDPRRRAIQVHLQQAGEPAFANEASLPPYPVEADVVAFTFADVAPAKGRELVLFTSERAVAVTRGESGASEYTVLFSHAIVWPAAEREAVLPLGAARVDLDGNGSEDLLLPEPDGALLVANPAGGDAARRSVLRLPAWVSPIASATNGAATMNGDSLRVQFEADEGDEGAAERKRATTPLVAVLTRSPEPQVLDLEGDGVAELVAVRNHRLHALPLDGRAESFHRDLPVPQDRLALFDPSFDVQLVDVDGDRRLDLLLSSSASRNDEIEVRMDLYRTRPDGTWPTRPDSRLRTQTLARPPQLVDVDGDGTLDLVACTLRIDALRALTGGGDVALEVQVNVFRGTGERFVTPALLNQVLRLPTKSERGGGAFLQVLPASGGELPALLHREGDTLVLQPFEPDGAKVRLGSVRKRMPVADRARPVLLDPTDREVLVGNGSEVQFVRMR